jgi:hypothetical protein
MPRDVTIPKDKLRRWTQEEDGSKSKENSTQAARCGNKSDEL